jgi:hypothetical protein
VSTERYIELIHGKIDGTNSPVESSELQKIIERDGTAREFQEDMMQLNEVLKRVEDAEVPTGLRDSIRSRIASRTVSPPLPYRPNKARTLTLASAFRLSAALAAGLVLGLIVGPRVFDGAGGWNPDDLGGAMMRGSVLTEPVDLNADRFSATIRGTQNGVQLLVSFDISAQAPVEVALEYDPRKIELTGFARRGGHFDVVEARDGQFVIHGDKDFRGNLLLERKDPAATVLRLKARRDGALLGEELLNLDASK